MCNEKENEFTEFNEYQEYKSLASLSAGTRRSFVGWFAGIIATITFIPQALASAMKKVAIPLDRAKPLQKVGGSTLLKIQGQKIIFVRDGEKTLKAINPACTHKKCDVKYSPKSKLLHCPCHKSAYDLDGTVLDGPAPRKLETFPATIIGDKAVVALPNKD